MPTRTARELRIARERGHPEFTSTPTTVASNGLTIPPIRRSGAHRWRLECDWSLRAGCCTVTVPEGRETDLADVPGVLRPGINDFEFGITGPLIHDFVYEHAGHLEPPACRPAHAFTRREADDLLWALMAAEGVPRWRRVLAYVTVRIGGSRHWRVADRT